MKPEDKDTTKSTSFWGIVFSAALHAAVLILVLFWGFSGTSNNNGSSGPIEVSLSDLGPGGGGQGSNPANQPKAPPQEPEKPKPAQQEPPPVEKKEEVKETPPEPEEKPKEPEKVEVKKEEPKEEPKKEEKPKEVVKEEPEKKEVIPLETEKKEEVKKEVKKEEPKKTEQPKETKKEVAEKPKPTEKPKTEAKKTTASKKKDLESEKNKVLQDIKRQRVLDELKSGPGESAQPEEEMGEEQRLAMADSGEETGESESGPGDSTEGSRSNEGGGGSSINPVLLDIYTKKVHQRISRSWRIPPGVPTDGSLTTMILFKVDQSGRVFDVRVNQSSGNPAFDEYSVSAIYKSAPLPPPPSEFAEEAKTRGVLVPITNRLY